MEGSNILTTGCEAGVESYAHSFKLDADKDGTLHHSRGSAPTVIAQSPRLVRDAVRAGRFDEARGHFVKAFSHFAVDVCTPYHVSHTLTAAQHKQGEMDMAKKLKTVMPKAAVAVALPNPKSLYQSAVSMAEQTYTAFVPRLEALQAEGRITDDPELCRAIIANAMGFGLSVALYIWRYITVDAVDLRS